MNESERPSPSKGRRLEMEDLAFYKEFYSPIDMMDSLRKCLVHNFTEEQLDSFFVRNGELKKYAQASNILTKRVAARRFLKAALGDEYVHYPLCSNLCGQVPNIVDTCGHARCSNCQPQEESCIICGRTSQINVAVTLSPPTDKPKPVPKWIDMGADRGYLVTNTYLFCDTEGEAKLLHQKASQNLNFTRSKAMLKKNNIIEILADSDEQCARMLATDVVEQRSGYMCIICGKMPRVYLHDCKHLYFCGSCIDKNGRKCPGCKSSTEGGYMALKHDLIYLEK